MPVLIGDVEMTDLAKKLAKMRFARAKGHIRSLDKKVHLDYFRNVIGKDQWHTRYTLPTRGLWITLIERCEQRNADLDPRGYPRTRFKYIEARVEPIPEHLRAKVVS